MWNFDQAKFCIEFCSKDLVVLPKQGYKFMQHKNFKKLPHQECHNPNPFQKIILKNLLVLYLWLKLGVSYFNSQISQWNISGSIGEWVESKIWDLLLSFVHQFHYNPPNSTLWWFFSKLSTLEVLCYLKGLFIIRWM
jgi:hypothetical protein